MNENPNEKQSESQKLKILKYMKEGNKIDFIKALMFFKCANLKGRIYDIKKVVDVNDKWVKNGSKSYKEYFICG